jgi:co-chaperonin GroES (HSP10)
MITPIKNLVMVEFLETTDVSPGGIMLTFKDPIRSSRAKVLAIGPDVESVQVGDVVLGNWMRAKESKIEDKDVYFIEEEYINAVFED